MANKTVKTRLINKHDTTTNWNKATNFIPKAGEVIAYTDTHKLKVGDGTTKVSSLPYVEGDLSNYVTESELSSTISETVSTLNKSIDLVEDEITSHTSNTSNPHNVTKAQIGLSSVVNAGQTATPTSGSNSYFTAGGAYTLKQAIDTKADESEVVKLNVNIGRGNTNSSAPVIVGGQIDTHPENTGLVLTYMMNDLAFLLSRGGSCILKNTTNNKTLTGSASLFDCTPAYMQLNGFLDSQSDVVEVWVKSPTVYTYNTNFGIGFGSTTWRAKSIKIEAGYSATNKGTAQNPDTDIKWKTITNITNYNLGVVNVGSSGPGTAQGGTSDNKWSYLKYTLTNWASINPRIAQIWSVYYSSKGLASGYVSRGGGDIYGSVNVKGTLTATSITVGSTNLQSALNGKADKIHTHSIDQITDLQSTLNSKYNTSGGQISGNVQITGQLVLQASSTGTNYGNNVYQYAAVRGDALKGYCDSHYISSSNILTTTEVTSIWNDA